MIIWSSFAIYGGKLNGHKLSSTILAETNLWISFRKLIVSLFFEYGGVINSSCASEKSVVIKELYRAEPKLL